MRGSPPTASQPGLPAAARTPWRTLGRTLGVLLLVLGPSFVLAPAPPARAAVEQPSGTYVANTADPTGGVSGTDGSPGASGTLLSDDSSANETADNGTDIADAKATGSSGSQSSNSSAQGTADVVPASGTAGATLTSDSTTGANRTGDVLATGSSGSNSTTSDASGGVADALPTGASGSQSGDSSAVVDQAAPDALGAGSAGTQMDDSGADDGPGDPPAPNDNDPDDIQGVPPDPNEEFARISDAATNVTVGTAFNVMTDFSGTGLPGQSSACVFRVRGFNNDTATWEAVNGGTHPGHTWSWNPVGAQWEVGGANQVTTAVTIFDTEATAQYHSKFALVYECADPDDNPLGDLIRVTVVMDRTEWTTHTGEINSLATSTADSTLTGKFRVRLSNDSFVDETYTGVRVHVDRYDLQNASWTADVTNQSLADVTLVKDGDANADATAAAGNGVSFSVALSPTDHASRWRVWAEFREPTNNKNGVSENNSLVKTNYVFVDRREWIRHTGTVSGAYTETNGTTTPFTFQVTSDVDEPVNQTFNLTVRVQAQRVSTGAWTGDLWTSGAFNVTIYGANATGDTASTLVSGNATLPADADYRAWRVYVRFNEPVNQLTAAAEDGADIETARVQVTRKEWLTHTLHASVAEKTADAFLDVTVYARVDQAASIAETYRFTVRAWAYDLRTGAWTSEVGNATGGATTLAAGQTQSDSAVVRVSWTPSAYYSRFRVQANATEPLNDKNGVAEDGTNLFAAEIDVLRREWITHRAHLASAATQSSDGPALTADVWVATDADLTMGQTFALDRILEGFKTNGAGWTTVQTDTAVASVTIAGTVGGLADTESNHTTLTWPALPSDPDYSDYRLKVRLSEPSANGDNSIADSGDTIVGYVQVARTEWVLETLNVRVPQTADPAAAVSLELWVTSDVDIDATRTYTVELRGHAYNQSGGAWTQVLSTSTTVTFTAGTGTGETESAHATATWTLPKSGYDSKYSVNATVTESGGAPTESSTLRVWKDFSQSALGFRQLPTVRRVADNPTPVTSQFYWPGDTTAVYSEVNYTYGADHGDYQTVTETVRYVFKDAEGVARSTQDVPNNSTGFTQAVYVLPSNAGYGVWTVEVTSSHDDDALADLSTATFVVRPLIQSVTTKRNGNATANVYEGTITADVAFVNSNMALGPTYNATLTYPKDDDGNTANVSSTNPSVDATTDRATFTLVTPADVRGGDATLRVNFTAQVTYKGTPTNLTALTQDGNSTDDALVHLIAVEQPTRNFFSRTHDAGSGPGGTNHAAGVSGTTVDDTSAATEAADNESDVADTKPSGASGSQSKDSATQGAADVVPGAGTSGPTTSANSGAGANATADVLPGGTSGLQVDDSLASEAGEPPSPENDNPDETGIADAPASLQVLRVTSAPTNITNNTAFTVTTTFATQPVVDVTTGVCTWRILGLNVNAEPDQWESVAGAPAGHTWNWDILQQRWEVNGDDTHDTSVTINDQTANAHFHAKYALVNECTDPEDSPAADKIRVTLLLNRTEWLTHTLEVQAANKTADAFIDATVQVATSKPTPLAETFTFTVRVWAFNLQTNAYTSVLDTQTGTSTVAAGASASGSPTVRVSWAPNVYYSKFILQANATEPLNDKNPIAENGNNVFTAELTVSRREWIAHRAHLANASTDASDGQSLAADVWVTTDTDLTMAQTYALDRVLEGFKTNGAGWTTVQTDAAVASVTISGTTGGAGETESNHTTLTWPALPSDPDYSKYRLRVRFAEPAANGDNSIADDANTVETYAEVNRTEWVLETLNLRLPQAADPAAAVTVEAWVTTDVDIDASRTYTIQLRGEAYNATAGQWRSAFTDSVTVTLTAGTGTGDTTSAHGTKTWTLPKSGDDSKYTVNASFTESLTGPAEASFLRTSKNFDQSGLTFAVAPRVKRVEEQSGAARYYFPGENLTVWSEANYTYGADYGDYGTSSESATYEFYDAAGALRDTATALLDSNGYALLTRTLPADAAFGVWTIRTTVGHDADSVVDNVTATFVVKPVIDALVTRLGAAEAASFTGNDTITLEARFLNRVTSAGSTWRATLTYEDTGYIERTTNQTTPSVNGTLATFSFAVPNDTATRDGRLLVNVSHAATFKGQSITLATQNRDNVSTVEALVHLSGGSTTPLVEFNLLAGRGTINYTLAPASNGDWLIDSLEPGDSRAIEFNAGASNRNLAVYVDPVAFTPTVKAVGTSNALALQNVNYATALSPAPTAGGWKDGATYRAWTSAGANYPALWIFFDDGHDNGTVGDDSNLFSAANSAPNSTANSGRWFSPAVISTVSGSPASYHAVSPTGLPSASQLQWSTGNAPTGSDFAFEVVVPVYVETATGGSTGTGGTLASRYVQVLLRADGAEAAVREGGTGSLSNWSVSGWDRAKTPDAALGTESLDNAKSKNVAVTLFGNRYVVYSTSTASGAESVILAQHVLLPVTVSAPHGGFHSALAFPANAPRADYTWSFTLRAVNWGANDGLAQTPDEVQHP